MIHNIAEATRAQITSEIDLMSNQEVGILGAIILTFVMNSIEETLNLPEVLTSYSTGTCVEVLNYVESDAYTCDNLPSKYTNIWVQ